MNAELTSSESSFFSSRRLSQQSRLSEMQSRSSSLRSDLPDGDIISNSKLSSAFHELLLPAMSALKSVPLASCFQAMPAGTVPTCASMSVSLGVPVKVVNTSEQMGGVTSAGLVRNGTFIESAAVCGNGTEQVWNVFASGDGETYPFDGDLDLLPKYDGAKKGLTARLWLKSMEEVRTLYRLKEKQMVPLTRFLCTGLAREWTGIQPDDQNSEQFKDAFLNEWGRVNGEKIFIEMPNHHQGNASVGEYAVIMQRYFL
jgi:hypothetical protein